MKKLVFTYLILFSICGFSQRTPTVFGQNRIQYKAFKWKKFETNNFEIYYSQNGSELAKAVAKYAEEDHSRIANILGYYSFKKIKLVVYNSVSDRKQSNIGLLNEKYQTGTETKYIKNKIEVSFNGSQADLKTEVTNQITNILIKELLYGNGMNQLIQSSYFVELPEWFTKGLSAYVTNGWSVDMDNYVRVVKSPLGMSGVNNLRGKDAELMGHSIWNFIVEKYGIEAVRNIVTFSRLSRDEKISITNTLGVDYKDFYKSYLKFYDKITANTLAELTDVSELEIVERTRYKESVYSEFDVSPSGKKIAFSTNIDGRIKVYVKDLETGKTKKYFKQGVKNRGFTKKEQLPILKWKNEEDLYIVYRGENEWSFFKDDKLIQISGNSLILSNLTGKGRRSYLKNYDQIEALTFSKDGEQMLLSVVEKGQSDLLLYMPKIKKTLRLTEDIYDDVDPVFLDEGKIVFSSNRGLDDEGFKKGDLSEITNNFDVFYIDVFKSKDRIKPLTNSLSSERKPFINNGNLYYIGNETGINSIYKYSFTDSSSTLIQQYQQNINNFKVANNEIYVIADEGKGSSIFVNNNENAFEEKTPVVTERQKLIELRTSKYYYLLPDSSSIIPKEKKVLTSPKPYPVSFSMSKVHSGLKIDPLLGFGTVLDITLTDRMENHSISGGIFALADFASHIIYGEYNYLKRRVDLGLKYERENYQYTNPDNFEFLKFASQKFKGKATLPFNYSNNISLNVGWVQTRLLTYNLTSLIQNDFVTDFIDVEPSYVFDNTTKEGLNTLKGTRMKISLDNMFGVRTSDSTLSSPSQESFNNIKFDLRNYTEVFKLFTWANRLSFGRSMGNAPKTFVFGGMDNWFGPKTDLNETPPINYTADVLYLDYVTSVRGFNYNIRNGNNFVLLNSELRLAYKKLTSFSTYKSNLIENLQFVFFTDLGTAWTGNNPTSKENSINKNTFGGTGEPYTITAYNYRSPLVMGFGGGVRTVVLGTYLKLDMAWGVEDLKVKGPKFYLTLGYDF